MDNNTTIQKYHPDIEALELQHVDSMAAIFVQSGWFPDVKSKSQCIVKIMVGREIDLTPLQSMQQIYVFPTQTGMHIQMSGNLIASKIRTSGKYDYKIIQSDDKVCEIEFFQISPVKESLGKYKYTFERATKAGLTGKNNWKTNPEDMNFNRCISGGYKKFTPDIFNIKVYTEADEIPNRLPNNGYNEENNDMEIKPDQLPAKLNMVKSAMQSSRISAVMGLEKALEISEATPEADVVNEPAVVTESVPETPAVIVPEPVPLNSPAPNGKKKRPWDPDVLKEYITQQVVMSVNYRYNITAFFLKHVNIALSTLCVNNDEKRHQIIAYLFEKKSSKELSQAQANALMSWMQYEPEKYSPDWIPSSHSIEESKKIFELFNRQIEETDEEVFVENEEYEPIGTQVPVNDQVYADALFGGGK